MASIFLDKQSRNWKLKTIECAKDKRVTLRKALPSEAPKPIPADVVKLATERGFVFSPETPKCVPPTFMSATAPDDAPDDLMGFLDYFIADYATHHRPGSIKRITGIVKHFRWFLAALDDAPKLVSRVSENHVMTWFHWRRQQRDPRLQIAVKPHVVVGETEQLSGLFKLAMEKDKLAWNPCRRPLDKLRKAYPKPDPADETKYVEYEELGKLVRSIDDAVVAGTIPLDYADLAKVMLSTGLRVQAALDMDFDWLDGSGSSIKVPAINDKNKTGYTTMLAALGREVVARRRGLQLSGRVFPVHMTQAMSYYYLRRLGVTNHTLRHSFATALVDEKVAVQTIGSLLGHKCIATTQRYAKVRDQTKQKAVAALKF